MTMTEASGSSSKEEQLARVRRNQQRCRDRKRAHTADLESRVRALQSELQQCAPCSPALASNELDQIRHENAARRDLLLSMGVTDEMQRHFIDSLEQRLAVYSVLNGTANGFTDDLGPSFSKGSEDVEPAPMQQTLKVDLADGSINDPYLSLEKSSPDALPDPIDWTYSLDTASELPNFEPALADDLAWLEDETAPMTGPNATSQPSQITPAKASQKAASTPNRCTTQDTTDSLAELATSMDRCFLENAMTFSPSDATSTPCSIAIRMVLQHNRKGLSLAEVHRRMKPGFVSGSGSGGECMVRDDVLWDVLGYVSVKSEDG